MTGREMEQARQIIARLIDEIDPVTGEYVIGDDWDGHELAVASDMIDRHGYYETGSFSLASTLRDLKPQCSIEGRPGCWRVYERRG